MRHLKDETSRSHSFWNACVYKNNCPAAVGEGRANHFARSWSALIFKCHTGSFGMWKGFSCRILALFCFVKFRRPSVTKLNISSMLHYVPNPQGLLQDSCGYSKRKLALAGKQKEPKGSKNARLEVCLYSDCIFFPPFFLFPLKQPPAV